MKLDPTTPERPMTKLRPSNVNILEWFAILPKIALLVEHTVTALKDGKVTREEIEKIGADLVSIVAAVG